MKRSVGGAVSFLTVGACLLLGVSLVHGQTGTVYSDSAKATYKEIIPGVSASVVWGDMEKGPYGAFIKFAPGHRDGLHTHTNSSRLVVLKGAYIHKPEKGGEQRVGSGQFMMIQGGDRHVTESDAREGALFYLESDKGFDLKPVK